MKVARLQLAANRINVFCSFTSKLCYLQNTNKALLIINPVFKINVGSGGGGIMIFDKNYFVFFFLLTKLKYVILILKMRCNLDIQSNFITKTIN